MQHEWHTKAEELSSKNSVLEADASFVKTAMEKNEKLKEEAETAKKTATEAVKEAKLTREELRTCQLNREYHKEVAETKTSLASNLHNDLQAQTEKCGELAAELKQLKEQKKNMLADHAKELEDIKDAVKICFYMFRKYNRNVDFSYSTLR